MELPDISDTMVESYCHVSCTNMILLDLWAVFIPLTLFWRWWYEDNVPGIFSYLIYICVIHVLKCKKNTILNARKFRWENIKTSQGTWSKINSSWTSDAIWRQGSWSTIVQVTASSDGTKPLPKTILTNHQLSISVFTWWQFYTKCSRCPPLIWF